MHLTPEQHDALTEVVNIGVGRAAAALSELCGERVEVSVPRLILCELSELEGHLATEKDLLDTFVLQDFHGGLSGRAVLAFPRESAFRIGQLLGHLAYLPQDSDLDLHGILTEVGNLVLNGVLGSIANLAQARLLCSLPELITVAEPISVMASYLTHAEPAEHSIFVANVHFCVERRDVTGSIMVLFECDGIVNLLNSLIVKSI